MAAVVGVGFWLTAGEQLPVRLGSPTTLPELHAEALYLDAADIVRRGSPRVFALRFSGGVELVPYNFSEEGLSQPLPVEDWAAHLKAPVVFNAGQFDENLAHLGWLKKDGNWLVPNQHFSWQGLLLSGPTDGAAWARIADLDEAKADVVERYRHVVQSMMLVDGHRRVRVRETDKTACRTIVAEDTSGRMLVLVTEGAVTLADLARWLLRQNLDVVRAMNLDGGVESQLAVHTPDLSFVFYGQYGTGTTTLDATPGTIRYPLPAVIAVRPVAGDDPGM